MSDGPGKDPLGAKPMLPPPTGAAADRAGRAFAEYVRDARRPGRVAPQPRPPATETLPDPSGFGDGRRYDLALSMVQPDASAASVEQSAETAVMPRPTAPAASVEHSAETAVMPSPTAPAASVESSPGDRPPPGAPTIRPPVSRPKPPDAIPQELLETVADTALLSANPDGSTSFDIAFNDELFENLACRISVTDGVVVATFSVSDDNTRRLLEAEAGRLRVQLEERGLRVAEIRVEMGSSKGTGTFDLE